MNSSKQPMLCLGGGYELDAGRPTDRPDCYYKHGIVIFTSHPFACLQYLTRFAQAGVGFLCKVISFMLKQGENLSCTGKTWERRPNMSNLSLAKSASGLRVVQLADLQAARYDNISQT